MPARRHARSDNVRLSPRHERCVVGTSLALLLSGVLWLLFHYFVAAPGEFGDTRHPLEVWWLRLHGAAAMGFLIVLGTLLPVHVRRAWELRRNYRTGVVVLCIIAALLITGYALYYASTEELRPWISGIHWMIGLIGLPAVVLHLFSGRRAAARRQTSRTHDGRRRQPPADRGWESAP